MPLVGPIERRARPLLGTFVEIGLREGTAEIFEEAFAEVTRVHDLMSAHSVESDLAKIARDAHREGVIVDEITAEVIRLSLELARASDGAFDPVRAGAMLVAAGKRPSLSGNLPDSASCWQDLSIDGLLVKSTKPLALDLGGVAKGYAADMAALAIARRGISGIVNAGGDMRFIGDEPRNAFVKSPEAEGGLFELRELPSPALATTGSYPWSETGDNLDLMPTRAGRWISGEFSITVFADNCMLADAMTKAVLNLSVDMAGLLLERYACSALVLESGGRVRELP